MTTFASIVGDGTAVLTADDDPNTTAPDSGRIFTTPAGDGLCYITTLGASDNPPGEDYALATLWGRDSAFSQWYMVLDIAAVSQVLVGYANNYVIPRNMDFFLQLYENHGTTGLTRFGVGYLYDAVP